MSIQNAPALLSLDRLTPDDSADLFERMQSEQALRANEKFVAGQRDAFELAMKGAPIVTVLSRIVQIARGIFEAGDRARAAIFTVDATGTHLRFGVAADMSEAYSRAVDGMEIGRHNPSCGTVAYTGETVIVKDVAADPLWAAYLPLAQAHDICACWSFPIRAVGGKVLGTLAVYHRAPREPEPRHLEFIGLLAQTAAVILERHKLSEERLAAEEKLRQSEARFRALFNEVPVAIYSCDREGLIDELNPLAIKLWGRAPVPGDPQDRFCGSHKAYLLDGTYMSHEQTPVVAVLNGDLPAVRDAQVVLERPDGSRITVVANIVPLKNDLGEIVGAMNCFYDISERKLAEEALRTSEERYRNLFSSIDEGFCIIEMIYDERREPVDYRFLEVNPTFEKQTGLHEATGKSIRQLVPGIEAHWFELYGKVALTGDAVRSVNQAKAMGGRWFDNYAFRIGGPGSCKLAIIFTDVSDRKRSEQQAEMLSTLSRELASATVEADIIKIAVDAVGRHFNCHRCYFVECLEEQNRLIVSYNWVRDEAPSIAGEMSLFDFGGLDWWRQFARGNLFIEDVTTHPLTCAHNANYLAVGVPSYAVQPFRREGDWTVCLVATESSPRKWTAYELRVLDSIVARVWPLVERARADQELRASEERYRTLFNAMDEGYCIIEMIFDEHGEPEDYRFLEVNRSFEAQCGLVDAVGKRMRELAPNHEAYWFEIYGKVARTGEPIRFVRSGSELEGHWFDLYAFRLGGPDSSKVAVVFNNITQRMMAERALRESEERYRNLFNSIDEGFCVIEMMYDEHERPIDYRFLEVNPAFEKQSGLRDAPGKTIRELAPTIEPHWFEIYGKVARTGEPVRMMNEVKSLNRWLDVYGCRVGGPESRKVAVVFNDITERRQADQKFRDLLESAPDAMVITDQAGRITLINAQTEKLFRYDRDELIGQPSEILIPERLRDRHPDHRRAFLADPRLRPMGASLELWALRKDGTEFPVEISLSPLETKAGILVTAAIRDITDRKRAQDALTEARNAAEAANNAKDKFLAVLSHELRTPLTPVVMTLAALEMNTDLPLAVRADLKMIQRNIDLETKLIDDLLDLSRIISGKLRLQLGRVDVNDLLRNVCDMCRSNIREKSIRLHCDLDEDAHGVVGDPGRLQQVFWNLLNNSTKFTPEGGHIYIDTENAEGGRLRVRVRDTGIGIPPETLPYVFDAFEQGDVRVAQFGGMGLGLAICKALVEQHKGSIHAETGGPNKGSTFIVDLPAISPEQAAKTLGTSLPGASSKGTAFRVLVVEDHADTAKVLSRLLTASGHAVMTAPTVAGALSLASLHPFDIVVSDLGLPDATGYDLMKQIKAKYGTKGIAMSGYGMEEDLRKSEQAGFSDHLVKPVNMERLERAIRQVIQNGNTSQERW